MTGEYQVKKAYDLLHKLQTQDNNTHHNVGIHASLWKILWKLKLPHKILTFTWKILHHALPVRLELHRRGIHYKAICGLCSNEDETMNHLLLLYNYARAIWLGMGLNTSNLIE